MSAYNKFHVGILSGHVVLPNGSRYPLALTREDALNMAAWLVALASFADGPEAEADAGAIDSKFAATLAAVRST